MMMENQNIFIIALSHSLSTFHSFQPHSTHRGAIIVLRLDLEKKILHFIYPFVVDL